MTLLAIWRPALRRSSQIVVASDGLLDDKHFFIASDSRLSGGIRWDCCPKIFPLDRKDCLICFAGSTYYAYPIILQVQKYISMHDKIQSRAIDVVDLAGSILNIVNDMYKSVYGFPSDGRQNPEVNFVFIGHSHKKKKFIVRHFKYNAKLSKFQMNRLSRRFYFFGDEIQEASKRVAHKLQLKNRSSIEMEPLEVLVEMIKEKKFDSIGGVPQIYKLYPFSNNLPLNVYWPSRRHGAIYFCGRRLLAYEKNKYLAIDVEDFTLSKPNFIYDMNIDAWRMNLKICLLEILNKKILNGDFATS